MKNLIIASAALVAAGLTVSAESRQILGTDAYRWVGDTIFQGEFKAYAPSDFEIVSTYSAQPGYFMPIEKQWKLKNDISGYPQLKSGNRLQNAIYNMGLDEMINAVEPDTTLRTGKEWAGVWTRDVSYSIILSMAYLQPEASKISLMKKVNRNGRIVQDTGSGGAWPVSSDRMIWAVAAYELYKVTGDKDWLEFIYPVIKNSIEDDFKVIYSDGGVNGETSFIDWREQSYPKWMQTADIYASQAQGTGAVHVAALDVLSKIAEELGHGEEAKKYGDMSAELNRTLQEKFWNEGRGNFDMYSYGRAFPINNPRSETLGQSFAILYDQLTPERAATVTENIPVTKFGPAIFYPQISDMPAYHNNALWPFVASYYTLANAKAGNEKGLLAGIGSVYRPAALFATNKENFNLDNGDIATELNSSNMLWSLAGNLAIAHRILMGLTFETDGLHFNPVVPKAMSDTREMSNIQYRDAKIDLTVEGYGNKIASCTVNGKPSAPFIPADAKGDFKVVIRLADNDFDTLKLNNVENKKAPLTPIARLVPDPSTGLNESLPLNLLEWHPIEYIGEYIVLRDGKEVARTRQTSYPATIAGEYQVIGVAADGTQSFASEPLSNRHAYVAQPMKENTDLRSREVSYQPASAIEGFHGSGFYEMDHATAPAAFTLRVPEAGRYALSFRYANGNGPVNTENKCAIRSVVVNGYDAATVVMPQRGVGNWNDWGMTNVVVVELKKGLNKINLTYEPHDENMNLATNHAIVDEVIARQL